MARAKKVVETGKTLMYETSDGEFQIDLPPGARFTFGPALPFERKNPGYSRTSEYSIRIYADKTNASLIAVITGVHYVRDISIPVRKLVVREQGKSVWKSDDTGYEVQESVKKDKQWQDASQIKLLNE